jgi:ubiquitin
MSREKNKRGGEPKHISDILKQAQAEWNELRKQRVEESNEFKQAEDDCKEIGTQLIYLYINGDPEYIRTIFLN